MPTHTIYQRTVLQLFISSNFAFQLAQCERNSKDLDHQFDIPEDDDVIDVVEDILEPEAFDAATTDDIVLMLKTYH